VDFILVKIVYSPPLAGVLDPTSDIRGKDSIVCGFSHPKLDKMASNNNVHIGKPPHFDGNNYDYWEIRMSMHLKAMGGNNWPIVRDVFVVLKVYEPSLSDNENILTNDQAMNVFYDALDINEFNRIKNLTTAHEI
jgi:hypothetical protein